MIGRSSPPPASPYGTFSGSLFQFARNLVAFESVAPSSQAQQPTKACILLGGLSDGLIPTPYTKALESECHAVGWSLVQPILSSSYLGFGNGDLDRDTAELCELMSYLMHHRSAESFALVGHSTGCQNSVHFLKHGSPELLKGLKVVALQAPVSDRELPMTEEGYNDNIKIARDLVADGKGSEMMPRKVFWAPITAQRFLDLQEVGGRDDFFSSDFSDEEMVERLGHVGTRDGSKVLVAFSGSDEFVLPHVDKKRLVERILKAMNHRCAEGAAVAESVYLENGNHNLSNEGDDAKTFVTAVADLLKRV